MPDLHIERHRARYHLGKSSVRDRYRLDAIAGAIFEDSSGTFLSDASWGEMEEVCIRSLDVVVPVDLGASDRLLAERWSVAIAAAIRRAVASQSDSVIRYRSRRAAVLEMVSSICRDDRRREWAWRQIGLVPKGLASRAGDQVEDALLDDPRQVVPVIALLAEDGLLPSVDELLDSLAWWRLAQGAARAAGVTLPPGEDTARAGTPGVGALSQSIFSKSRIARAVTNFDSRALASDQGRGAVSVLIVLEADPALSVLATGRALGVMSAIRGVLATPGFARHVPDTPGLSTMTGDPPTTLEGDRDTQKRQPGRQASTPDPEQPETLPDGLASGDSEFDKLSASGATSVGSRTQWAGLLYLIHLVARLGIPEQVVNDETLGRRGLTWVLHPRVRRAGSRFKPTRRRRRAAHTSRGRCGIEPEVDGGGRAEGGTREKTRRRAPAGRGRNAPRCRDQGHCWLARRAPEAGRGLHGSAEGRPGPRPGLRAVAGGGPEVSV